MANIHPFRGWRYDPVRVDCAAVVTPPYDVITPELQDELYARSEYNAVRLVLGRQHDTDNDQDNRYTRAAAHLDAWREAGLFRQDPPAIYRYEQKFEAGGETYTRRGFFCRARLSEWGREDIYPHEKTHAGPKVDRLKLMRAVRGNTGPVFGLLTDPGGEISGWLAGLGNDEPAATITGSDGVSNRLWVVDDENRLNELAGLAAARQIFIADGHHRYETALAYRNEVREQMQAAGQTPPPLGELDSDYLLMLIVADSDPGLVIWPTHRLVHGLQDFSAAALLEKCREQFTVTEAADAAELATRLDQAETPAYGLALPQGLYFLALTDAQAMDQRAPERSAAWRGLDVSTLHLLILEDLLGINEEKLLAKENIIYSKSAAEAVRLAQAGERGVQAGFLMRPTLMSQVREVAGAGEVMPQKSTYFYPKVLSGLVFYWFW